MRSFLRHSCTLILLLAMGLGLSISTAHAMCSAAPAPALAGDMSLRSDCNDCGGQSHNMAGGRCVMICAASAACSLFVPAEIQLRIFYAADRVAATSTLHEDWLKPLDPFPPKHPVLI